MPEWRDTAELLHRNCVEKIMPDATIPEIARNKLAVFLEPTRALLRRAGLRNGPYTPEGKPVKKGK